MKAHLVTSAIFIYALTAITSIVSAAEINNTALQLDSGGDYRSLILNICIIFMGLVLCILEIIVLIKRGKGWGPYSVRIVAVTLIATVALLSLTTNVGSSQNVAPLWGLLGTIAGYVLGETRQEDN